VGLNNLRLLILTTLKLGLAQTLDQSKRLALKTTVEASTGTAVDELDKLE
jgi:hypothetical protein